jgi:hypothetical protein
MSDQVLADVVLILHLAVVLFNVGALPLTWIGWVKGWALARNFYFRAIHLLLIGFVAVESLLGAICPLTIWEAALRETASGDRPYESGFIAHWVHKMIYYDLPPWVFTTVYLGFFALVVLTFIFIRPVAPRWWKKRGNPAESN